jgi:hypothetical protein
LARQLQLVIEGAYTFGQTLGPEEPAQAVVADAGRVLIAAQIAA